jgi:hypothetical protein
LVAVVKETYLMYCYHWEHMFLLCMVVVVVVVVDEEQDIAEALLI